MAAAKCILMCIETSFLLKFKQTPPNSSAGASSYSKTTIPNIVLKLQRSFSKLKKWTVLDWPS
ncbi:hypothetical protein LDENG_00079330 [Lucifuga dentata]|nr:hypothetical protein LDENG_00079330 [Lucifuga dentata]